MRICIDSCVFILGLRNEDSDAGRLLDSVGPHLNLIIPRIIAKEVDRNLVTTEQKRRFYHLFHLRRFAVISDKIVPHDLLEKYVEQGLREKGDAFIGAFSELEKLDYLISTNRHFLKELASAPFQIMDPSEFVNLPAFQKR